MIDQGLDSYYHQYAYQLSRPLKLVSHSYVTIMHSKQGVDILMPAINVREVINKIQKRINGIVSHGAGNAFFFFVTSEVHTVTVKMGKDCIYTVDNETIIIASRQTSSAINTRNTWCIIFK